MTLENLNTVGDRERRAALSNCCGSSLWVNEMMKHYPFNSEEELFQKAGEVWFEQCDEKDWLEAFTHHPKIGDLKSLEEKFAATKTWAATEQASVQKADAVTIAELAHGNEEYENKFGFIFIVCATGKSAEGMLRLLENRLPNSYDEEIKIATQEQAKITNLRLQKLLS
jgi:2-oxo-4-hydroxy-4-carboxy-5-ureidoimidazoline decarboxylase